MAKATFMPKNEPPGPCGVKVTRLGRAIDETITTILRKIDVELIDLLGRRPNYHGKMVLSLNFNNGRFMNMKCSTDKMIPGEKVHK